MDFHLSMILHSQALRPFTLWSDAKIWKEVKKPKINPILVDNGTEARKGTSFRLSPFILACWSLGRTGAYHTDDLMKSLSSYLCPPPGLGSTRDLLTSPWDESSAAQRGTQRWRIYRCLCLSKVYFRSLSVLVAGRNLLGRQKRRASLLME